MAAESHATSTPVIYQVYPRSFRDTTGNGSGDIRGITSALDWIASLGVDGIWLSPCFSSPQCDGGYDVTDYRMIDPMYGTLADMEELIAACHDRGLRIYLDLVPNHTSAAHEKFVQALKQGPGSPAREWYWFRDIDPANPDTPPNNWESIFGGSAWTKVADRPDAAGNPWAGDTQWYLHLFDPGQPDLNWNNDEVKREFLDVLRFWFDKGVDGFRIDVAGGLVKEEGLPDMADGSGMIESIKSDSDPRFDNDGVHEIYRSWREFADSCAAKKDLVGELWVDDPARRHPYISDDELDSAFAFDLLLSPWTKKDLLEVVDRHAGDRVPPALRTRTAWALSNHDTVRHVSRFGLNPKNSVPNGIGPDDPQPDHDRGLVWAKAATLFMLALPGSAYLYQGEELGLFDHTTMDPADRLDPTFVRSGKTQLGRDGCRAPLPWKKNGASFGFSPTGTADGGAPAAPWLPQPDGYGDIAADCQDGDPSSTVNFYRAAIGMRKQLDLGAGSFTPVESPAGVLVFDSHPPAGETVRIIHAIDDDYPVPDCWRVVMSSAWPGGVAPSGGTPDRVVEPGTTVWCVAG
ncbi:alpha-amylase family glycosyl hydrolase [Corynebacterium mendelii]|uniref:Glycosyl hydrolase family 13 catalytic domain-containing protein n=1 Tax=Corynebacterium mendelii TaxID=2765362 RepID=A0A939E2C9_9CORY|nr:alpha-amylase family glycosyl hydrolase [Corynebacterium mendelii]MBN9645164.1 hypothetical protein [Corynebacterium mendelii]